MTEWDNDYLQPKFLLVSTQFQSPRCPAVPQYHLFISHVQFGFRTFNTEQDRVGGTVTRIRAGNREVVFRFQSETNRLFYCQQHNRP